MSDKWEEYVTLRDEIDALTAKNDRLYARAHELAALRDRIQAEAEARNVENDRLRDMLQRASVQLKEETGEWAVFNDTGKENTVSRLVQEIDRELEGRK